ncbi:hypothetical protein BJ912DRAFT_930413 [Pholiota molesta]|nr:hypothetical protein BJ912DRAFT_930413 [Pholiota molesta]
MSPSATAARDDAPVSPPPPERLTKVPLWIPISAFVGTSLALALPLFLLRRRGTSRLALSSRTAAPPPRRAHAGATVPPSSPSSSGAASSTAADGGATSLRAEIETPSAGELMSALARVNADSGLLAAKAFGLATALVLAGGAGAAWAVRATMDVHDVIRTGLGALTLTPALLGAGVRREDARRDGARRAESGRAHPAPPAADETPLHTPAPGSSSSSSSEAAAAEAEAWSWEHSQRRLQRAYEDGGFALWAQVALREMELEAGVEREKRERQFRAEDAEGGRT